MEHSSERGPRSVGNVGDLGRVTGEFRVVPEQRQKYNVRCTQSTNPSMLAKCCRSKKKRQMALGSIISFKITGIYVHFQGLYDLTGGYPHVSFARKKNTHTTYGCFWLPMKRHRACECRPLFRDYHRMPSADNFRMDSNRYPEGRLSPCFCFSHMSGPTPG